MDTAESEIFAPEIGTLEQNTLHVFIDTNVFLSFFAFTGDDLDELKKLVGSIRSGALKLYLPRQVVDEFDRNREKRIKDSIDKFAGAVLPKSVPRLMQDYQSCREFTDALNRAEKARDALVLAVKADAGGRCLGADKLFEALRTAAGVIEPTPELLALAHDRNAFGNPPGKLESIGDQLIWETLLAQVVDGNDLHVVSKDGDYRSILFDSKPHQFLADEWKARKRGELVLHQEIKPLLKAWFPAIQLRIDKDKNAAIEALDNSSNFVSTHQAIEKLSPFVDLLTPSDVGKLATAAIENNQIRWIVEDPDVADLYKRVLPPTLQDLPSEVRDAVVKLFNLQNPST